MFPRIVLSLLLAALWLTSDSAEGQQQKAAGQVGASTQPQPLQPQGKQTPPSSVRIGPSATPPPPASVESPEALDGATLDRLWQDDLAAATELAATEGKDLLILFTASDWVELCQRFDREVIHTKAFNTKLGDRFVRVRLEYPRGVRLPKRVQQQRGKAMADYRVRGYPTIVLTDAKGRPYAVNGYQPIGADAYASVIAWLGKVREKRDAAFAAAASKEGIERARLLVSGIPQLPGNLAARYYRDEMQAVIDLDPQNRTGMVNPYQRLINDVNYAEAMQTLDEDVEWSKMITLTDRYIEFNRLKGENLQHALMNKVGVYRNQGKLSDLVETLVQIARIDPKSRLGQQAIQQLQALRIANLEQFLKP